ncbi:MAG: 1-deoxy-D-xylulose-5-phosphate reductoisomerase [Acidobacteria bacterium]|nr:1-deoxy-D-xylulose-5-phosphate reductoisomerase [Acidobacteriota bacterium]
MKPIVLLGATGSIGTQTREVAKRHGWEIVGLAAHRASSDIIRAAREYPDAAVVVTDPSKDGREHLVSELGARVSFGIEAMVDMAASPGAIVVNGVVGAVGLRSSVAALKAGNRLALANKESLVAGGPVVIAAAQQGHAEIIPVDSEHSALWQCLVGEKRGDVRRLIVTASGGPFRGRTTKDLLTVTVDEALNHPTFAMGQRLTIDSATLMNKALEVIEAHYLFDMSYDQIDVVVHPQSIIHSMVEYIDGAIIAQIGVPDMHLPIQYALSYPDRVQTPPEDLDLTAQALTFYEPDVTTFRCLALGYAAGRAGGSAPTTLNAADEVAVAAFLDGRISFLTISEVVEAVLDDAEHGPLCTVDDVIAYDTAARRAALQWITSRQ